jgi:tripartite-type tricarboxylate transporter receptor subunit TctC
MNLAVTRSILVPLLFSGFQFVSAAEPQNASGTTQYPTKTIRMLAGFAPGGGVDALARLFGQKFSEVWGQNVVVDNRPGAGGNIATDIVAKAAPDGHTLLLAVSSLSINPSLYKLPYDTVRDLAPISLLTVAPNIIVAHPSLPAQSILELVGLAKSKPGILTYASPGSGQASHLAMELFAQMTGTKFIHVPYNGGGPSIVAVLAGQTQLLTGALPTIMPHVRSGKLRPLAVTSAKRTQLAPDVPTVSEGAGLPGYEADVWYGMLAPAGTPTFIVNMINVEIERLLQQRDVRDRFALLGFESNRSSPAQFGALVKSEIVKWEKVVRVSGAQVD